MPYLKKSSKFTQRERGASYATKRPISLIQQAYPVSRIDESGTIDSNIQPDMDTNIVLNSEYEISEHIKSPRLFSFDNVLQDNSPNVNQLPSFVNVSCGNNFTIIFDDDGKNLTLIGSPPIPGIPTGEPITELEDYEIKFVAAGGRHIGVLVARQWIRDEDATECTKCKAVFTAFRRKHHCRNCGGIFCGRCTQNRVTIMRLGYSVPQRVCEKCFEQLKYR